MIQTHVYVLRNHDNPDDPGHTLRVSWCPPRSLPMLMGAALNAHPVQRRLEGVNASIFVRVQLVENVTFGLHYATVAARVGIAEEKHGALLPATHVARKGNHDALIVPKALDLLHLAASTVHGDERDAATLEDIERWKVIARLGSTRDSDALRRVTDLQTELTLFQLGDRSAEGIGTGAFDQSPHVYKDDKAYVYRKESFA